MKNRKGCSTVNVMLQRPRTIDPEQPLVNVTDRALSEIRAILGCEVPDSDAGLRIGVVDGGCSGLSYDLEFSKRQDADVVVSLEGVDVLVDEGTMSSIEGVTLDFEDGLKGKGFVFSNPNASRTCACGDSFRV